MSDAFRKLQDKRTGKGGVHCYCCNSYKGKSRKILNRLVRRVLNNSRKKDAYNER